MPKLHFIVTDQYDDVDYHVVASSATAAVDAVDRFVNPPTQRMRSLVVTIQREYRACYEAHAVQLVGS